MSPRLAAITLGVAVAAGALTFNASSNVLVATPRLYGVTWDLAVWNGGGSEPIAARLRPVVEQRADVVGASAGGESATVSIDGTAITLIAFDSLRGNVRPPIVEGRAPSAVGEVALGTATLRRLGTRPGDAVRVPLLVG